MGARHGRHLLLQGSSIATMAGRGLRQSLNDITAYLLLVITIATVGSLQYGYHLAELNAPQDVITCRKSSIFARQESSKRWLSILSTVKDETPPYETIPHCIPMNEAQFATISSMFTLGGLIGALCAGPFSSSRGRLPAMRVTALLYALGSLIATLSPAVAAMAIGRLISGMAAGASTVIVPLYISEVAPPEERGLFGVMTQVSINVGILAAQTFGYFLSHGSAWRWVLGIAACIAATQGLGSLVIAESPAWLAANGNVPAAKRTLQRIRGSGYDIMKEIEAWDRDETNEREGLLAQEYDGPDVAPAQTSGPVHLGFHEVIKNPDTRPAIVAVIGIMFAQQLCGINSIIMYSVSLLADLLPISSALLTILISAVNLIVTIACSPLPDRLGRKKCLLLSIMGQGTSSLILALSILFGYKILSAFAVLFFVGFFAVGLGPVPFMMASELVSQEAVGATQSWSLGANYIATFLVAQFFPIINTALNDALGGQGYVYFIFAALAAASAVFVSWKVPETHGKKDVDEVWGRERRLD